MTIGWKIDLYMRILRAVSMRACDQKEESLLNSEVAFASLAETFAVCRPSLVTSTPKYGHERTDWIAVPSDSVKMGGSFSGVFIAISFTFEGFRRML